MATWQHLRSSTANKRPTTSLADGRIAINTNTASPGLFFKDSAGTGIVKVGPVHVGTTAPNSSPAVGGSSGNYLGEQWLDTSVSPAQLKVWNGTTWVGVVADGLPVSKLQDGAARQLIQTDAAGTGVEWTSNVDVPGTLDVTSTATFDSIAQHPLGTAGAPTITFTGDTNTGIYSPGADQLALSTSAQTRVFVSSTGNVGIGTTSPGRLLTLNGGGSVSFLQLTNTTAGASSSNGLEIYCDGTNAGLINRENGALTFDTNNTERARIDSSGKLLIGTSTDGGPGGLTIRPNSSEGAAALIFDRNNTTNTSTVVTFENNNGTVGTITYTNTAVAYNTTSDYRLKENVTPVTDGITRLQQLKPSRFNFIADPDKTVDGFLAHEVQTVVPEAITGEKDAVDDQGNPQYQGIDQAKLVPLLTAALQEAIGEIESLKARLTAAGL